MERERERDREGERDRERDRMGYGEEVITDKIFIMTEFQKNICDAP